MGTRKIIFSLFFTLGLIIFVFAFVNFLAQTRQNKNLFTASLGQNTTQNIVDLPDQTIVLVVPLINEYVSDITLETKDLLIQDNAQDQIDDEFEKQDLLNHQMANLQKEVDLKVEKIDSPPPPAPVVITTNTNDNNNADFLIGDSNPHNASYVPVTDPPPSDDPPSSDDLPPVDGLSALPSPPSPSPPQPPVVINEIAWMGTLASTSNEWMELFNPGEQVVDLTGWKLTSADGVPTIQLFGSIAAHGFYLLERTDDNSVSGVAADQIYTGALGNTGENLSLYDALANVINQVNSIPWFAGDNTSKKTMQRKDPLSSDNGADNWQTSENIGGTPKF